jgi:hypothetical protein
MLDMMNPTVRIVTQDCQITNTAIMAVGVSAGKPIPKAKKPTNLRKDTPTLKNPPDSSSEPVMLPERLFKSVVVLAEAGKTLDPTT